MREVDNQYTSMPVEALLRFRLSVRQRNIDVDKRKGSFDNETMRKKGRGDLTLV